MGLSLRFNVVSGGGEEMQLTHLLFADDTLVFCSDLRD